MDPSSFENASVPPATGIRDFFRILGANFFVFVACLALGIGLGLLAQEKIPKAYESRARFLVNEIPYSDPQLKISSDAEQTLVQTFVMGILSRDMRGEVARQLGVSPKQLAFADLDRPLKLADATPEANIRVDSTDKSRMGEIIATSQSSEFAAAAANAILDNLQLFNRVSGRLKNLRLGMDLSKIRIDGTVKDLVDISSKRSKLEQENAELEDRIKRGLPLRALPSFAQDATLNNLKTQFILVDSEYSALAATVTRGPRLDAKRAEVKNLTEQVEDYVQRLARALRSAYAIARTQQQSVETDIKESKAKIDRMAEQSALFAQSLGSPAIMRTIADEAESEAPMANVIVPVDRAAPKIKPMRPKLWLNLLLGGVFGAGLGAGLVSLRVMLDTRLRSAREIEGRTGQPCLALLPKLDPIRKTGDGFDRPRSPIGLGYLRSHLLRAFLETKERQIVGFTPSRRNSSTSLTVATLGLLLAQAGHRILIIDLYRKGIRVAAALGLQKGDGLSRWLASDEPLNDYIGWAAPGKLGVLGFGKASRELDHLLGRRPISMELPALLNEWDFILIASPAIRADWSMMLTLPPGSPIIVTADYRDARVGDVTASVQRARNTRWTVEGIVLQNCPQRLAGSNSL